MDRLRGKAGLAVILGTGLSGLESRYEIEASLPFEGLPGLGGATAPGHPGRIALVRGRPLLLFLGRLHCYEGLSMEEAGRPARAAAELGCGRLLLTQAAGGLRRDPPVGSWILADDIVTLPPFTPGGGFRRPGAFHGSLLSGRFSREIIESARGRGVPLARGTVYWTSGPAYETPSEAASASELGAAAASMSGLPELAAARSAGMEAALLSLVTNHAPTVQKGPIDHGEVVSAAAVGLDALAALIDGLLEGAPRTQK